MESYERITPQEKVVINPLTREGRALLVAILQGSRKFGVRILFGEYAIIVSFRKGD